MDDQRPAGKRRLSFSIRDMFWFVLVAALAIGWWLDHRQLAPKAELVEPLQAKLKFEADDQREIVKERERIRWQFDELFKATRNLNRVIAIIRLRDPKLVEEAQKFVFDEQDNQK